MALELEQSVVTERQKGAPINTSGNSTPVTADPSHPSFDRERLREVRLSNDPIEATKQRIALSSDWKSASAYLKSTEGSSGSDDVLINAAVERARRLSALAENGQLTEVAFRTELNRDAYRLWYQAKVKEPMVQSWYRMRGVLDENSTVNIPGDGGHTEITAELKKQGLSVENGVVERFDRANAGLRILIQETAKDSYLAWDRSNTSINHPAQVAARNLWLGDESAQGPIAKAGLEKALGVLNVVTDPDNYNKGMAETLKKAKADSPEVRKANLAQAKQIEDAIAAAEQNPALKKAIEDYHALSKGDPKLTRERLIQDAVAEGTVRVNRRLSGSTDESEIRALTPDAADKRRALVESEREDLKKSGEAGANNAPGGMVNTNAALSQQLSKEDAAKVFVSKAKYDASMNIADRQSIINTLTLKQEPLGTEADQNGFIAFLGGKQKFNLATEEGKNKLVEVHKLYTQEAATAATSRETASNAAVDKEFETRVRTNLADRYYTQFLQQQLYLNTSKDQETRGVRLVADAFIEKKTYDEKDLAKDQAKILGALATSHRAPLGSAADQSAFIQYLAGKPVFDLEGKGEKGVAAKEALSQIHFNFMMAKQEAERLQKRASDYSKERGEDAKVDMYANYLADSRMMRELAAEQLRIAAIEHEGADAKSGVNRGGILKRLGGIHLVINPWGMR